MTTELRVLGLDQSLTSFGAAVLGSGRDPELYRWQPPKKLRGCERLDFLLRNMESVAGGCDFAVIEGLAFGAVGRSLLDLAGLFHVVTYRLWQLGIPYAVVPPNVRAKYIAGDTGAGKTECVIAICKRFPDVQIDGDDMADAFTLAAMGMDWAGQPLAKMPAAQRAVLTSIVPAKKVAGRVKPAHPAIEWPKLNGEAHAGIA